MKDKPDPGNPTDCRDLELITRNQEDKRLPANLWLDEIEASDGAGNQVASAIEELQAYIEPLGSFFTFGRHVKSVKKKFDKSGKYRYERILHMGKAKCMQPMCMAKGRGNAIAYTSRSRDHLKTHYKRVHSDLVHQVAKEPKQILDEYLVLFLIIQLWIFLFQLMAAMKGIPKRIPSNKIQINLAESKQQLTTTKFSEENAREV